MKKRTVKKSPVVGSVHFGPRGKLARRSQPSLHILAEHGMVIGYSRTVSKPGAYGKQFKKGDVILDLHFTAKDAKETVALTDKLLEMIPDIQSRGFSGICIDTPNTALANLLKRKLAMSEMEPPGNYRVKAATAYRSLVKKQGYPEKYRNAPVKRLVLSVKKA